MDQQHAEELLEKYRSGHCNSSEKAQVEDWITHGKFPNFAISEETLKDELNSISNSLPLYKERGLWPRMMYAAAAITAIVIGLSIFYHSNHTNTEKDKIAVVSDIAPGKVGATLTLANGKKIRLDDITNGEVANQAGIKVTKTKEGQLVYEIEPSSGSGDKRGITHTLSTARGETYILTLPDKSKVWLNAASSITYSADLVRQGIRKVQLQGEAYFEIAKDHKHPFIVSTSNQEVQVLGTHFNINSYADEPAILTTLVEGSIKVSSGTSRHILMPDQQSSLSGDGSFNIKTVNATDVISWKEGLFLFEDETLESIMRQISRWYNVDVQYEKNVDKDKLYGGGVSRYDNVSTVLEILESTKNIHFKIDGRRILVMK
ncbi:FecR family protein [Pedobacter frigoris]|uniref:FecR family protein n=1 Tax=Pedobacter frigoris TaxID=2571272 RepID=UPI0029316DAA|nr:FecR domain-containing protein [Pedobacter frigoris]